MHLINNNKIDLKNREILNFPFSHVNFNRKATEALTPQ